MPDLEVRTFEQRFGKRCFCGKSWGDPNPCGDSRADRTIRDSLFLIFADRKGADCAVCGKQIAMRHKYCYDCAANVAKYRNRQSRHAIVRGTCEFCGEGFEMRSDKRTRGQRYCSRSCSNRAKSAAA